MSLLDSPLLMFMPLGGFVAALGLAALIARLPNFSGIHDRESRFETLDGLRGFLALGVCFHHFMITYFWKVDGVWTVPPYPYYENLGKVGVALFFMITGFLFVSKLLNAGWKVNWLHLYESRVFRIFPVYLFAVLLITIVVFYRSEFALLSSWGELARAYGNWGIFHGVDINRYSNTNLVIAGVEWTLQYEWLFYLSLPLLALFLEKSHRVFKVLLCLVILQLFLDPFRFSVLTTKYLVLFLVGGLCAYHVKFSAHDTERFRSPGYSLLALLLVIGMLLFPKTLKFPHLLMMGGFFFLVVKGNDLFGLFRLRSSKLLGEISYSIYLLHGFVLYLLFTLWEVVSVKTLSLNEYLWLLPLVAGVVVMLSSLTFELIEKPAMVFGKRYPVSNWISKRRNP